MEPIQAAWRWDERALSADASVRLKRIFARCEPTEDGCLIWTGCITKKTGYGRIGYHGEVLLAHRLIFELARRHLLAGEHVDHLCHNADNTCTGGPTCVHRRCLEPSHLEAVTQAENNRRSREHASNTPGSRFTGEMRGTCKRGLHPWVPENIFVTPQGPVCRACKAESQHAYDLRTRGPGTLSLRPINPIWAELGLPGCRECGSNQNGHKQSGLCHTCNKRKYSGASPRGRLRWLDVS